MNHVYRLIWNESEHAFVVASENTRSRGKRAGGGKAAAVVLGTLIAGSALAQQAPPVLPTGAQVVSGQAAVTSAGAAMTVQQASDKAAINWTSFSIGAGASVNFVQPSASAITLNRVVGTEKSVIDGALNANGQVFLLNSNGVLFNRGASVNTGGLVASTLGLSDGDFNAGNYRFTNDGAAGAVVNLGTIKAADGGYVALLGPQVSNQGLVAARLGTVALAGGDKVSLNLNGGSLVGLAVDQAALDALVENGQALHADGGQVILTAKAVDALLAKVVNNTGEIRAQSVQNRAGHIYLLGGADGGTVAVGGTLDASAPNGGDGGFIETSGAHVKVDGAKITTAAPQGVTGNWLVDPNDYVIAASGGDITGAALSAALDTSNVTIQTATQGTAGGNGDILVNDAITKTGYSPTTLTLQAERNIEVNQAIQSNGGRLNMILTADANGDNVGNVAFGEGGSAVTAGGNFTAGATSAYQAELKGQDFTMAAGSYIDVGIGNLDVDMAGTATLAAGSLRATNSTNWPRTWYNNGEPNYYGTNRINVVAGAITSANLDPAAADIVASTDVKLEARAIGTADNPIKVSGPDSLAGSSTFPNYQRTLYLTNTAGDSYVNEIGVQAFGTVNLTVGSQANSVQQVQIMGDAGPDGLPGHGHVTVRTGDTGVVQLAANDIDTSGAPGTNTGDYTTSTDTTIFPTSVALNASDITVADNAVNTGGTAAYFYIPGMPQYGIGGWAAGFSATASHAITSTQVDGIADISAQSIALTGTTIGQPGQELELGGGSTLSVYNTGGSTSLKVLNGFGAITLYNVAAGGTHQVQFSDGDHISYSTDDTGLRVAPIGDDPFMPSGIDTHLGNRSVSLNTYSGAIALDTGSVNLGSGAFGANILNSNTSRDEGRAIYGVSPKDGLAEVTAGDVSFNVYNSQAGAVSDIEIAKGGDSTGNTLSVSTFAGNVDLRELTENHFKNVNVTLYGANTAQTIAVDLAGPDDLRLADSGTMVTLDANSVNLAAGNRNFNLSAGSRSARIDGTAGGSGYYNVYAGAGLRLNGDVLTNGGSISLTAYGSGIALEKSVRIDSNADDTANSASAGAAGGISLNGTLSATGAGSTLTVDASSSDGYGNTIQLGSAAANSAGAYLSGLALVSAGADRDHDGYVYLNGGSYRLNGDFSSFGNTIGGYWLVVDTEQGNVGNAGNISFGGRSLATTYWSSSTFDASTTAEGANAGNIDLAGTFAPSLLYGTAFTALATGGAGGASGSINLPGVTTVEGGTGGAQVYRAGAITLNGNLSTDKADITLAGDTRLARSVVIDTWNYAGTESGRAGSVAIDALSATEAGKSLTIDTSTDTGAGHYGEDGDFNHSAGAVSLAAGGTGGALLDSLDVIASAGGIYNTGSAGAISLGRVATGGAQSYRGGAATLAGDLATNGGAIDFGATAGVHLAADAVGIRTDLAGGANAAGNVILPAVDGAAQLSIDTSADNGGAAGDAMLGNLGTGVALRSLDVKAGGVSLGAVHAQGNVTIDSLGAGRDLAIDNAIVSDGGSIVLATGRGFINNAGANALAGNWQVWSNDPANDALNGLAWNFKQYDAHYGESRVLGAGNGIFYSVAPVISATLTGSISKVYDGSTLAMLGAANVQQTGAIDGDTVAFADNIGAVYADANAASGKTVTASDIAIASAQNDGRAVYGYRLASGSASGAIGTITPKALSLTGVAAIDRTYDGTTTVQITGGTLAGLVGDETLAVSGLTGTMADKNAGAGKAVTLAGATLGDGTGLASNYTLESPASLSVDIARRALQVQAQAAGKVYDGGTAASVSLSDNRVEGDQLSVTNATANFSDKNAGQGKIVTVSGIGIAGEDAGNYIVNDTALANADIARRELAVAASAAGKVYDGNTSAQVDLSDNRVEGDRLSITSAGASFSDKNAGKAKTVTVSGIGIAGEDAGNYVVNDTALAHADIAQRELTVAATAAGKVYDGSTAANVNLSDNRVAGDQLSLANAAATFSDKNAGKDKTVTVSGISVDGADATNYTFNDSALAHADIAQRELTVAAAAAGKVYDGSTAADVTLSDNRVEGDQLSITSATASFSDKNAGKGKTVTVGGIRIDGADAANYVVSDTSLAHADIAQRGLTVAATAAGKIYDGNTSASVTLSDNRVEGDQLQVANATASFSDKNAAKDKTVAVSGIGISGEDAGNYVVNDTALAHAGIAQRELTVAATAAGKVYDGSTAANVTLSDNRVEGDQLQVSNAAANFSDKNAGKGKTVTVNGISVDGADAANYTFNGTALAHADIAQRELTVAAAAAGKVYDGRTAADVTLSDNRVEGDQLSIASAAANFSDKDAGKGKTVTVSGIGIAGEDAGNYVVNDTALAHADIARRDLAVRAAAAGKVYDGNTSASVTLSDNRVEGDQLSISDAGANFSDKNAASGKVVTVTGIGIAGIDAANYTVNTTASSTADITPRQLDVTASASDKMYDGTGRATIALSDDRLAGDVLNVSGTGQFSDANIGNAKTVNVTGIALSGADAANYTVNGTATANASIQSDNTLTNAVTTIVNQNVIAPSGLASAAATVPPASIQGIALPVSGIAVTPAMPVALDAGFDPGSRVLVVMAPSAGGHSEAISEQGMQQVIQPAAPAGANVEPVRIPLSRDSIATVVNGGLHLPEGVTQEFFITPSK